MKVDMLGVFQVCHLLKISKVVYRIFQIYTNKVRQNYSDIIKQPRRMASTKY